MYNKSAFKRKLIASAVASTTLAGMSHMALAQDGSDAMLEEVVVTGIRASVTQSMDIKRSSSGVVDAISAEEMGKFPDTNLAESLQRITGVSISRDNGEGSEVTVRGFGADYNMVTLNGRHMPASNNPGNESNSRAFDFGNLASEGVSALEVYKTGRADIASGGIGASINIETRRPLDNPGLNFSVAGKAVHDTTNREGDDVTPELSGLFSWTDDSEMFGVGLFGSYQERDSGSSGASVTNWLTQEWDRSAVSGRSDMVIENEPEEGQLWSRPTDLRYDMDDVSRTRTNAQLVLQFRPMDRLTGTLDYTYAENEMEQHRAQQSVWYVPGGRNRMVFDDDEVKTPILLSERHPGTEEFPPTDLSFANQFNNTATELNSVGLNVDFDVTDSFNLELDYHDSSSESRPNSIHGSHANASAASFSVVEQAIDWSNDLPVMIVEHDDSGLGTGSDGQLGPEDITTTRGTAVHSEQSTDIEQFRLMGELEFDNGDIQFGIESRSMENHTLFSQIDPIMGDWAGADPNIVPDEFFWKRDFSTEFDDYSSADDERFYRPGIDWDFNEVVSWAGDQSREAGGAYPGTYYDFVNGVFQPDDEWHTNRRIEEDTTAAYFQVHMEGQLGDMPTNFTAGVRYEDTDVDAESVIQPPNEIAWQDNDDVQVNRADERVTFTGTGGYDHLLPSMDFDIEIIQDVKARLSYSETIARPTYNHLRPEPGSFNISPSSRTASQGDPNLVPLESKNFDVSLEWYYDESSYVSAGYFEKRVTNFIGSVIEERTHFGLRDPIIGPRRQQAEQDLIDGGNPNPSLTQIFDQTLRNEGKDPEVESTTVFSNSDDPLVAWNTEIPENSREAKIDGWELALQHLFTGTGFGVQANYTIVDGDIAYDNNSLGNQFALLGLSDTANLVGFYEDDKWQVRLSYNWRDNFLDTTAAGGNNEPGYTEAYSQLDANVSYNVTDNFSVFFEGINLTEENARRHGRTEHQLLSVTDLGARYQLGARYTF